MITTVTTTTTTTVTSMSAGSLALIAICTVLLLLLNKEMLLASNRPWARRVSQALNVAIVPLLIVFVATIIVQVAKVLG